jgi:hypothetical protein
MHSNSSSAVSDLVRGHATDNLPQITEYRVSDFLLPFVSGLPSLKESEIAYQPVKESITITRKFYWAFK